MNFKSIGTGKLYSYLRQRSLVPPMKKIFFLHVAKCGGTSVNLAIRNSFGFGPIGGTDYFRLDPEASFKAANGVRDKSAEFSENILLYYMSVQQCRYISGHFLHSETAMERFEDEWSFITLLRHPVSKWFSKYFYNRHKHSEHYKLESDLSTYLASPRGLADGRNYVRVFAGAASPQKLAPDEAIHRAIENLSKFRLVGVLEHIDCFTTEYESLFGAKLSIGHKRRSPLPESQREEQITDAIRARVTEICQPNLEIYQAALRRVRGADAMPSHSAKSWWPLHHDAPAGSGSASRRSSGG